MREVGEQVQSARLAEQFHHLRVAVHYQQEDKHQGERVLQSSGGPSEELDREGVDAVVPGDAACLLPAEVKLVEREDPLRLIVCQKLHCHLSRLFVHEGPVLHELDHTLRQHLRDSLVEVEHEAVLVGLDDVLLFLESLFTAVAPGELCRRKHAVHVGVEEVGVVLVREEAEGLGVVDRAGGHEDRIKAEGLVVRLVRVAIVAGLARTHEAVDVAVGAFFAGCRFRSPLCNQDSTDDPVVRGDRSDLGLEGRDHCGRTVFLAPVVPDAEGSRVRAGQLGQELVRCETLRELASARAHVHGAETVDGVSLVVLAEAAEMRGAGPAFDSTSHSLTRKASRSPRPCLNPTVWAVKTTSLVTCASSTWESSLTPGSLVLRSFITLAASTVLTTNTSVSSDMATSAEEDVTLTAACSLTRLKRSSS
eukprot:767795-Hanusia_phi.AAC.2